MYFGQNEVEILDQKEKNKLEKRFLQEAEKYLEMYAANNE
jgi:hypothetical protein